MIKLLKNMYACHNPAIKKSVNYKIGMVGNQSKSITPFYIIMETTL